MYSAGDQEGFQLLRRWSSFISNTSPSVLVCIENEYKERSPFSSSLRSEVQDWCLDHGIEHLALPHDSLNQPFDNDLFNKITLKSSFTEEFAGWKRVLEALESNMWTHLTLKQPIPHNAPSKSGIKTSEEKKELGMKQEKKVVEQEKVKGGEKTDNKANEKQEQTKLSQECLSSSSLIDSSEEVERSMMEFESLLGTVMSIRTANIKAAQDAEANGIQLTDAERRKRAEDGIMKVLQQLGLDGEGDSEEDGEDENTKKIMEQFLNQVEK